MIGTIYRCLGSSLPYDSQLLVVSVTIRGAPFGKANRYRCTSNEITILLSNKARYWPRQLRGPAMNGTNVYGSIGESRKKR
jgi:hypothetical protein